MSISYKDSKQEWIGSVPASWQKVGLKYLFSMNKGRKPTVQYDSIDDGLVPYLSMDYLRGSQGDPSYADTDDSSIVLVDENDLLILWDGSKAGEVLAGREGALSSTMSALRLKSLNFDLRFLFHYLKNSESYIQDNTIGMGIPHVDGDVLKSLPVFYPDYNTQKKIGSFLDHQTKLIDSLIAKKEQLIEKLKEQRQAIINEAVTKGLDPNVEMKDTGVKWLGEIPGHWELLRLKHLVTKVGSGVTPRGGSQNYLDSGVIFLRSQNIYSDGLKLMDTAFVSDEVHQRMSNSQVQHGDVLLNITGASIGRVFYWDQENLEANVNQHVCIIRPSRKVTTQYLHLLLISDMGQNQIFSGQDGTSREGLNFEELKNFYFPMPPQAEMTSIVSMIQSKVDLIGEALQRINHQLSLLIEYRKSLVSEAVTGKIDVRNRQASK